MPKTSRSGLSIIGGKTKWNNPSLRPAELIKVAKSNPRAYTNPNLPIAALKDGAKRFPWFVEQNPALGILELEDPGAFQRLRTAIYLGWIIYDITKLSRRSQMMLIADLAERSLPYFEAYYQGDPSAREAIKRTREIAEGRALSLKEQRESLAAFYDWYRLEKSTSFYSRESSAVRAAVAAFSGLMVGRDPQGPHGVDHVVKIARDTSLWAYLYHDILSAPNNNKEERRVEFQELLARLCRHYYYLDHPESKINEVIGGESMKRARVGSLEEWENPETKQDRLVALAESDPRSLMNPNMPIAVLGRCALNEPWFVERNPVFLLLSIEDPAECRRIMTLVVNGWKRYAVEDLPDLMRYSYAADCAEHVIHILDRYPAEKEFAAAAIKMVREMVSGMVTLRDLEKKAIEIPAAKRGASMAVNEAVLAAAAALANGARRAAHFATQHATTAAGLFRPDGLQPTSIQQFEPRMAENRWQAERARYYYGQLNPGYTAPESIGGKRGGLGQLMIGAKTYKSIKGNLKASSAEIVSMSVKQPFAALSHPNCPPDLWWRLATQYPLEAPKTPAGELFLLENPLRWHELEKDFCGIWIEKYLPTLDLKSQRLFAADCAESVLPIFVEKYPHDSRLGVAILAARNFANGLSNETLLRRANKDAEKASNMASSTAAESASNSVICASNSSENYQSGKHSANSACSASVWAIAYSRKGKHPELNLNDLIKEASISRWKLLVKYLTPMESIGGKPKWSDPSQKPEELERLAKKNPRVYSNPNLPLDVLVRAARDYPWEVQRNPALGLLQLDDPLGYQRLERALIGGWTDRGLHELSVDNRLSFAADCAEHVLPLFSKKYPDDFRPRIAIQVLRDYLKGIAREDQLSAANKRAAEAIPEKEGPAKDAAMAAYNCSDIDYEGNYYPAMYARQAAIRSLAPKPNATAAARIKAEARRDEEIIWQAGRLYVYYCKQHPEYAPPKESIGRLPLKVEEISPWAQLMNALVRESWGDKYHLEQLDVMLYPRGQVWSIGPEKGRSVKNGIATYTASYINGVKSWRFVMYENGKAVSALQVLEKEPGYATIDNVYTLPSYRKRGLAAKLLKRARKKFKRVVHSALRSPSGNAWAERVGSLPVVRSRQ